MFSSERNIAQVLMEFMQWISFLVYLNVLWILGVLAGGIVLGIGPSTMSLSSVLREVIWDKKEDIPLSTFFIKEYKRIWKDSNLFTFLFYFICFFAWLNLQIIVQYFPIFFPIFSVLLLLIFIGTIYFILFYDVFNRSLFHKFKSSILVTWLFPVHSLGILALSLVFLIVFRYYSALAVLFFVSGPFSTFYYLLRKKYWKIFHHST